MNAFVLVEILGGVPLGVVTDVEVGFVQIGVSSRCVGVCGGGGVGGGVGLCGDCRGGGGVCVEVVVV